MSNIFSEHLKKTQKGAIKYLSDDTELSHAISYFQESFNRFRLLPNGSLMNLKLKVIMVEIVLHLRPVYTVYVLVGDRQNSTPFLVAICEI